MSAMKGRLTTLRSTSIPGAAQLVFRKAIYRRVEMRRYGVPAADSRPPTTSLDLPIEILGPERYREVLGTNPHLAEEDIEHFDRQRSVCIAVRGTDGLAASSWMTSGDVYVHELQRAVDVPPTEHFSCRSFVDPDFRGLSLMSHMIHHFAVQLPPNDRVWGLVYPWNTASVRSLERIGWRHDGDYWTTYVFNRQHGGERHFTPRPPEHLA